MPPFGPVMRRELIRVLRQFGFEGPYPGGKHQYMVHGGLRLFIPNPHDGEIGRDLPVRILRQAGLSRDEWEKA
jgi:predicted RNA binding protein YcfA (HicA-like mRNA interferase family)